MYAHPIPTHRPTEFYDLLDEEFDTLDIKQPFSRKSVREQTTLLCMDQSWDDQYDSMDMLSELQD